MLPLAPCSLTIMRSLHPCLSGLALLALHIAAVTGMPNGPEPWVDVGQKQASFGTVAPTKLAPQRHPYGFWDSPLSPEWMVKQVMLQFSLDGHSC